MKLWHIQKPKLKQICITIKDALIHAIDVKTIGHLMY